MMFENLNGLATDGIAGPDVWSDLLQAVADHQMDPNPWDWVYVQKTPEPETLFAWSNGKMVFQTPANTGATGFVTPDGSWPVYLHCHRPTMQGDEPQRDPLRRQGRAVGELFLQGRRPPRVPARGSYGMPQSLGCVEMPTAAGRRRCTRSPRSAPS